MCKPATFSTAGASRAIRSRLQRGEIYVVEVPAMRPYYFRSFQPRACLAVSQFCDSSQRHWCPRTSRRRMNSGSHTWAACSVHCGRWCYSAEMRAASRVAQKKRPSIWAGRTRWRKCLCCRCWLNRHVFGELTAITPSTLIFHFPKPLASQFCPRLIDIATNVRLTLLQMFPYCCF